MSQTIKRSDKQTLKKEIKYFIDKGKYDIALSKIDDFLKSYPKDVFALTYKSIIYKKKKDYNKAIQILEPIINNKINDKHMRLFAMQEYARNLFELKKMDESLYYYMQVINESDNDNLESRDMIARIYEYNNDLESAINILTLNNDNVFVAIKRALLYSNAREWDMLKAELDKIKRKDIKRENLRQEYDYLYGFYFFNNGDFDEARKHFNNANNIKNTYYFFESNIMIATIDSVIGDVASAIINLKNIINEHNIHYSSKCHALVALGKIYLKIGNYEDANNTFSMIEDGYKRKGLEMGKLYLASNDYVKAEQILTENADKYDFINYETLFYLAMTKFRLKKYDEAYKIADDILKIGENKVGELYKIKIEMKKLKLYIDLIHYTPIRKNKKEFNYMESQIFSYTKEKAIEHIIDHHKGINKACLFDEDFEVEKMIDIAAEILDEDKKICDEVLDRYVISSNSIGYNSDHNFAIMVLTIPNTKQVVNMFPRKINLDNENKQELQSKKIKRMSQIEKFNKRFNKTQV